MGKIVTGLFMSLDGVVESFASWAGPYFNDELFEWIGAGLPLADAILLGRRTYLEFAGLWPGQGSSTPMGAFLNNTPSTSCQARCRRSAGVLRLSCGEISSRSSESSCSSPVRTSRSPAAPR